MSSSGRWGRRRVHVSQCAAVLKAEQIYERSILEDSSCGPGFSRTLSWNPQGDAGPSWSVEVEIRANAVWRRGRPFLVCPGCRRRATRVYVPVAGLEPRCRRCWALSYETQSWNYKGVYGKIARGTTAIWREDGRRAARARQAARRQALAKSMTDHRVDSPCGARADAVSACPPTPARPVSSPVEVETAAFSYSFPHEFSWMG